MRPEDKRKKEISDYVDELMEKSQFGIENAYNFNSFEHQDQNAILWIYKTKACNGELKALVEDKVAGIEEVALLYKAQQEAFQDVLTKKGFDLTKEVKKDYSGRIAFLTNHGTFAILGKDKPEGRYITMSRIHSPHCNHNHQRGRLNKDHRIGEGSDIHTWVGINLTGPYQSSPLRELAINPRGADGDELEAHEETVLAIGMETAFLLMKPREEEKLPVGLAEYLSC